MNAAAIIATQILGVLKRAEAMSADLNKEKKDGHSPLVEKSNCGNKCPKHEIKISFLGSKQSSSSLPKKS